MKDDELRQRLIETSEAVANLPPSTEEVLLAGRRQRWRIRWLVAALAAIGALLVVGASYAGFYGRAAVRPFDIPLVAQPTVVPKVVEGSFAAARERLEHVGLKAAPASPCKPLDACRVKAQSPAPGARVEKGTAVELKLVRPGRGTPKDPDARPGPRPRPGRPSPPPESPSKPDPSAEEVLVPSVVGKSEAEAIAILKERRLIPSGRDCPAQHCNVTGQYPARDQRVPVGTKVTLELEEAADEIEVPPVEGMPLDEAASKIKERGLEPMPQSECPKGATCVVDKQSPTAGTKVKAGAQVDLYLDVKTDEAPQAPR